MKIFKQIWADHISITGEKCPFRFHSVKENDVRKVILSMDGKKTSLTGDIHAGILKGCIDFCISVLI